MVEECQKRLNSLNGMYAILVLLGIVWPGLLVLDVVPGLFGFLIFLLLPVIWTARWRTVGFFAGVMFVWLYLVAFGFASRGPGQVDNPLPAFTIVLGPVFAICYLGPVYLISIVWHRDSALRTETPTQRREPFVSRAALVVLVSLVAAIGFLRFSWTMRPRHPQHVAIDAIEAHGGLVEVDPSQPGQPVRKVRLAWGREKIGDAEMKCITEFEQLRELEEEKGISPIIGGVARRATATMAIPGEAPASRGSGANLGRAWPSLRQCPLAAGDHQDLRPRGRPG
ncbi:MAG: hypothetical protein JW818_11630 [Pirellulales bacterium]|nr:hypothetical protein [Pirellulales bacterium]